MILPFSLDEGAFPPERAHATDAGIDLRTPEAFVLPIWRSYTVDTGIHIQLPHNMTGIICSKSGLNVKHNIITTGLIDEGYSGSIHVKVYNLSGTQYVFSKGDKIAQLIVVPVYYLDLMQVDAVTGGERGDDGFGSTGR